MLTRQSPCLTTWLAMSVSPLRARADPRYRASLQGPPRSARPCQAGGTTIAHDGRVPGVGGAVITVVRSGFEEIEILTGARSSASGERPLTFAGEAAALDYLACFGVGR